jgi:DNA-binding response OmpR family regulator
MANTILIVDTNAAAVSRLVKALRSAGLAAIGARGFGDALKRLAAIETDLLITSVRLGPYNGLHLFVRARALYPTAAAIIIGPADPTLARDARALGAGAYLTTLSPEIVVLEALKILRPSPKAADGLPLPAQAAAGPAVPPLLPSPA